MHDLMYALIFGCYLNLLLFDSLLNVVLWMIYIYFIFLFFLSHNRIPISLIKTQIYYLLLFLLCYTYVDIVKISYFRYLFELANQSTFSQLRLIWRFPPICSTLCLMNFQENDIEQMNRNKGNVILNCSAFFVCFNCFTSDSNEKYIRI